MRRDFKRANFTKNEQNWKAHADLQRCYKYSVLAAQKKGWEDYCGGIESYTEAARLNQILAGKPGGWLDAVRLLHGEYAESSEEESLKLLLETHYPGFWEEGEKTRPRNMNKRATKTSWEITKKIFTPESVRWAEDNLAPYKVPGVDRIYPVLLQEGIVLLIGSLTNMFRSFLALGHVPEAWKIAKALFIPKAERSSHVGVKDCSVDKPYVLHPVDVVDLH